MPSSLLAISVIIICTPLSVLLLWLWIILAGAVLFTGNFDQVLHDAYHAVLVEPNAGLAIYTYRLLIGIFGGFIGWLSLAALLFVSQRPLSRIPAAVKLGCLIGGLSALSVPAMPGVALPPILLCGSLLWLAAKRDA